MSDQGKNDNRRDSGSRWEHADKVDSFRAGWNARGAECLLVLDEKGKDGLAEYVRRTGEVKR